MSNNTSHVSHVNLANANNANLDNQPVNRFALTSLPYAPDALIPYVSIETISYHYDKHHRTYLNNLNDLLNNSNNTAYSNLSLEEIIVKSRHEDNKAIFNNSAQVWNHWFYWQSLNGNHQTNTSINQDRQLFKQIILQYSSIDKFLELFTKACLGQFGSGWAWLYASKQNGSVSLDITTTSNADTIIDKSDTIVPLLVCDVWEHAYYIDYRNSRANYVKEFCKIINWEFANQNFISSSKIAYHE